MKVVRYGDKSALPVLEVNSLYALSSAMSHNMYQKLLKEVHVWSKLDHENVIKLLGLTAAFNHTLSIVSPLMSRGNAFDYVQDPDVDPRPLVCGMSVSYLLPLSLYHLDLWNSKRTALPPYVYRRAYYSWRYQRRGCIFF